MIAWHCLFSLVLYMVAKIYEHTEVDAECGQLIIITCLTNSCRMKLEY